MFDRVVIIVLDSLGVGEMPDAYKYGDKGSNTLANLADAAGGITLPNLKKLGLGNIIRIKNVASVSSPKAFFGKMLEKSAGKDTTTGHWELMGIVLEKPFPTYPNGFPEDIVNKIQQAAGIEFIGNEVASGTEIIERLGIEHIKTKKPILYTSADSVFQVAAHEKVIPVNRLYQICKIARKSLTGKHAVGRVIARPFVGEPGNFIRTDKRKDFALAPPENTVLDYAVDKGLEVIGIGKIGDIFANKGITLSEHTRHNLDGIKKTIKWIDKTFKGILFTNLVDFDMKYGHRNDPIGYARALEEFDTWLDRILNSLKDNDILIITADHGCDPTTRSTDHSREIVPLLVYTKINQKGINLGIRNTFADVGATISQIFDLGFDKNGTSFLKEILPRE
jgi:phosphopentomutase